MSPGGPTSNVYYFAYATYLDTHLVSERLPDAKVTTLARASNAALEFRQARGDESRGWCHLTSDETTWGRAAYGVVYEVDTVGDRTRFAHNGPRSLTVYGEDGRMYDCWTYCLTAPGARMRVPDYEWRHLQTGMFQWNLPEPYRVLLQHTYDIAAPCPNAGRANPVAFTHEPNQESDGEK